MKIKVSRFRTHPHKLPEHRPAQPEAAHPDAAQATNQTTTKATTKAAAREGSLFEDAEDGFGAGPFPTARSTSRAPAPSGGGTGGVVGPVEIDAIKREGLTGRQLRMARRLAQKNDLPATSDFDAVRLLRKAGIDPFQKSTILQLVAGQDIVAGPDTGAPDNSHALTTVPDPDLRLPKTVKPDQLPSTELRAEDSHIAEVRRIQQDIVRRRRRKLAILWTKLGAFVLLPTLLAAWYFYFVATPMYTAHTEFVIQKATPSTGAFAGLLSGTSFATSQDSIVVQGYLQSPDAMERLDKDRGFRAVFQSPGVDPIQRLAPNASNSATYKLYRSYVKISYDPTEGVVKMDVSAPQPKTAVDFSRALISYAEEQVDRLTKRLRDDQMKSATVSYDDAQKKLTDAQATLVSLQEKYKTLSSTADAAIINEQISALETQLTQEKLSLVQMESNAQPNKARMDPVKNRITALQAQIQQLRDKMTGDANGSASVATVQSQLVMAQADVQTRQMMLAQATTALETSRIEANRQTRYLSIAVDPTAPDEPSYPKSFENTLVVMLIFAGLYLMFSMTVAILREQVAA